MLVAGYHLIWTCYGWWLPNDPRGSTSTSVRKVELHDLGELHYGRKRLQPSRQVVREFYDEAQSRLKHKLLTLDDAELLAVANSFRDLVQAQRYTCYACAVMPDHVHILIRKHRHQAEEMIEVLQDASRLAVQGLGIRKADHPVWSEGGWKGFLETADDFRAIIHYIEQNPIKIGRPLQRWDFVSEYNGWLPGQVYSSKNEALQGPRVEHKFKKRR